MLKRNLTIISVFFILASTFACALTEKKEKNWTSNFSDLEKCILIKIRGVLSNSEKLFKNRSLESILCNTKKFFSDKKIDIKHLLTLEENIKKRGAKEFIESIEKKFMKASLNAYTNKNENKNKKMRKEILSNTKAIGILMAIKNNLAPIILRLNSNLAALYSVFGLELNSTEKHLDLLKKHYPHPYTNQDKRSDIEKKIEKQLLEPMENLIMKNCLKENKNENEKKMLKEIISMTKNMPNINPLYLYDTSSDENIQIGVNSSLATLHSILDLGLNSLEEQLDLLKKRYPQIDQSTRLYIEKSLEKEKAKKFIAPIEKLAMESCLKAASKSKNKKEMCKELIFLKKAEAVILCNCFDEAFDF